MAKNKIFSGKDAKGHMKPQDERNKKYVSKYYGSGSIEAQKRKQNAIYYTNKYRRSELGTEKSGSSAHERYKLIMDALPKNQRDMLRNKVDGEYYSSGDLLDAAEEIAQESSGVKYFSKYQLDRKLKELKERNKDASDDVDDAIDDAMGLTPF